MKLKPPHFFILYLFVPFAAQHFFPFARIIVTPYNLAGVIIAVMGIILMAWALRLFKKKGTTHKVSEKPRSLVTTGPFSFSRNPIYLGFVLMLLGAAVYVGTAVMFLGPIAFFLTMNSYQIPKEEKTLEQIFGKNYAGYKKRARRWV